MKKIYLLMFTIVAFGLASQETFASVNYNTVNETSLHDRYRRHRYDDPRKAREREIEYRIDMLDVKYKRDKNRIENSYIDKYERKVRKKELEYRYKREKDRLKDEKKRVKNGGFYTY